MPGPNDPTLDFYNSMMTKKWYEKMAKKEEGHDIGVNGNPASVEKSVREDESVGEPLRAEPPTNAWLIEKGGLCLGVCNQRFAWLTFTDENALRFSRQRDAQSAMAALTFESRLGKEFCNAVVTEHIWR